MSEDRGREAARTRAMVRRGWWPGWIWAIPLAALLLVAWLVLRDLINGGTDITIIFDDVHGLKSQNTSVLYRGMKVGEVSAIALAKDGKSVKVTARIDSDANKFLRTGTQFWLRGAAPSLSNLSALAAVISGPTLMMQPGSGEKTTHFTGKVHRPLVADVNEKPVIYGVTLNGAVGGVKPGERVKLRGFTVGAVKAVGFHYDAHSGTLATPVTLALYPSLFHIKAARGSGDAVLKTAIDNLVKQGLRARLQRTPPLIGSYQVALDMESGASGTGNVTIADGVPQIPTASGGGLTSVVSRINKVPVDRIARNVLDITHHVDTLVASPRLKEAITQLDATLRQLHQTARKAGPQITQIIARLHQTAGRLDAAAAAANRTIGGVPSQNGLDQAVREITDAARSVRVLADYLDRHPEAVIRGRSGD